MCVRVTFACRKRQIVTDLSRIDKKFYQHPKAQKARAAEAGSISLWLLANCYCRDHRRQGTISHSEALDLGTQAEIDALVNSGLWYDDGENYIFKDWIDWNPDMLSAGSKSAAIRIVQDRLPKHPYDTQARLAAEVQKLIDEGVPLAAINAGLTTWGERKEARFAWLPYYVSDAIRAGESGIVAAIKEARRTWDMSLLAEYGYRWKSPELPDGMKSARQVREYKRKLKAAWLDEIEASLGSERTA